MKRYLLFTGDEHYPSGGWEDFVDDFDTVEAARNAICSCDWWHIVDSTTSVIIEFRPLDDE